jgi:hypothetical protein
MESLLKQNVFFLACSKRPKEALEKNILRKELAMKSGISF